MTQPVARMISRRVVIQLGLFVLTAGAVVVGFRGVISRVTTMHPEALPTQPFFVPGHAGLLYMTMPLVVLAALAMLLAPGIFLVLARGKDEHLGELVLKGFGGAFVVHLFSTSAVKLLFGTPINPDTFLATTLVTGALTGRGNPPKRRLLSVRSLSSLIREAGFSPPRISLPDVPPGQRNHLGRGMNLLIDLYHTAKKLPVSRQLLYWAGPLLHAVSEKPGPA